MLQNNPDDLKRLSNLKQCILHPVNANKFSFEYIS
jgi:hypothetical protein